MGDAVDFDKLVEHYASAVIQMCDKQYFISNYSPVIPSVTINAYNKVLMYASTFVGWDEKNNVRPNFGEVTEKVRLGLSLFDKARNGLLKNGISEDVLNTFSPVMILDSLLHSVECYSTLSLANSHIYGVISLIELAQFRHFCGKLIGQYDVEVSDEDIKNLVTAQSRLMVAQDALGKAYENMYRVRAEVRERYYSHDEDTLLLELAKNKDHRAMGGKNRTPPLPEGFQAAFDNVFRLILSLDKEQQLKVAHVARGIRAHLIRNADSLNLHWTGLNRRGLAN